MFYKKYLIVTLLLLSACSSNRVVNLIEVQKDITLYTSADFSPDGRLWRLKPDNEGVMVDVSTDKGKTFSNAVRINQHPQVITAWDEEPPQIKVDLLGRIIVLYTVKEEGHNATYLSLSGDAGKHFSTPVNLKDKTGLAPHYLDVMAVDSNGGIHIIWHDSRNNAENKLLGEGILSLAYTQINHINDAVYPSRKVASKLCSCCLTALAIDTDNKPVALGRFIFANGFRDHGLVKIESADTNINPRRINQDNWKFDGCPSHGPALSIAKDGRYHMTWFTQGDNYKGLYYAYSANRGKKISAPLQVGQSNFVAGKPDVMAVGKQVALTWKEFDGEQSLLKAMLSSDRGENWSTVQTIATSSMASLRPRIINDKNNMYVSWSSADHGLRMFRLKAKSF